MTEKVLNDTGEFDQYLGQLDLELHPLWEEAWKGQDQSKFETILHDFGVDLKFGYTFQVETYRARRKDLNPYQQVERGMVVRFRERRDKEFASYRELTDIIRTNYVEGEGSLTAALARVGMIESLGTANPMSEAFEKDSMEIIVPVLDKE